MVQFTWLDWFWLVAFLLAMMFSGTLFYRLGKRSESDFFLADRKLIAFIGEGMADPAALLREKAGFVAYDTLSRAGAIVLPAGCGPHTRLACVADGGPVDSRRTGTGRSSRTVGRQIARADARRRVLMGGAPVLQAGADSRSHPRLWARHRRHLDFADGRRQRSPPAGFTSGFHAHADCAYRPGRLHGQPER